MMDPHSIRDEASPPSVHRSVSLGEGAAVFERIAHERRRRAHIESVGSKEGFSEFTVNGSGGGSDEESGDEETLFDEPEPRFTLSHHTFREIPARHGLNVWERRFPGPVSGQAQQGRGQDTRPGQSVRAGPQDVPATFRQGPEACHAPAGQRQRQVSGRPGQEQHDRGQNTRPLPFDPHDILGTWVSPGHGHRPGQEQQGRGQNTRPLQFDTHDILWTETWVPQTPRSRFSQAQHASGHPLSRGQPAHPGHIPRPCQFPAHEHHPNHLPVQGPGHHLEPRLDPVPVGTYVVRLARSMGGPAVGIWRAGADGTWSPVVNLQGGSGEVVLPP